MELKIVAATILIVAAMLVVSFVLYKPRLDNSKVIFIEEKLEKNTQFQLKDGEEYHYNYMIDNGSAGITYVILPGENCTRIHVLENKNLSEVCVNEWGVDGSGSNSSFENPAIFLFKPWMLALKEGWKWNNSMMISFDGVMKKISETSYRVIRIENYQNRSSFLVEIKSDGYTEYEWIDVEKRIILGSKGETYEIKLTDSALISADNT